MFYGLESDFAIFSPFSFHKHTDTDAHSHRKRSLETIFVCVRVLYGALHGMEFVLHKIWQSSDESRRGDSLKAPKRDNRVNNVLPSERAHTTADDCKIRLFKQRNPKHWN